MHIKIELSAHPGAEPSTEGLTGTCSTGPSSEGLELRAYGHGDGLRSRGIFGFEKAARKSIGRGTGVRSLLRVAAEDGAGPDALLGSIGKGSRKVLVCAKSGRGLPI